MSCDYNTCFKGVSSINEDLLLNILEANFKTYFDWSFLNIGAWFDVNIGNSTIYGVNQHSRLLPVYDPAYKDGQVWQGIRKDWVWEQGIDYNSTSPLSPINSIIKNETTTVNKAGNFSVNYPLGRIVFNTAIPLTSKVDAEYSYRYVQVHRSSESPWFSLLQYSSFNTSNQDIKLVDGEWDIGGQHRIQMPCIVIEAIPRSRSRPYEIGNTLLWLEQDIGFYIFAETKSDRNKLLDIIRLQQDATLGLYNSNLVAQDDNYPLDYNGDLKNSPLMYPDIVSQYSWRKCFIKNISLFEIDSPIPNLHQGFARATVEIISS